MVVHHNIPRGGSVPEPLYGPAVPFSPGDAVAWRVRVRITPDRPDGEVGAVFATTLVQDSADEVVVYHPPGAPIRTRDARKGGPHDRVVLEMLDGFSDRTWTTWRRLTLRRTSEAHSVSLFWHDAEDRFHWWYIDFVSPLRRTRAGFDFVDHGIDLILDPDMASWRWKDADELDWYVEHGRYTSAEARAIREEGDRAVAQLRGERERFERWRSWRPDPAWPLPSLPDGWADP